MSEIKIGPGEIPKLIEPIKKIEPINSVNYRNQNQEQQQKPKEEGKGKNIDVIV